MKRPKVGEIWEIYSRTDDSKRALVEIHNINKEYNHYDVFPVSFSAGSVEECIHSEYNHTDGYWEYPLKKIYFNLATTVFLKKVGEWR